MNWYIYLLMYIREGPKGKERDTAPERMTRSKRASKRPMGNPEETIIEEPKEKKSRKNGSVEDNAKSKATDRDVDQSIRKALR